MKVDLFPFSAKKKKRAKGQSVGDSSAGHSSVGGALEDDDHSSPDVMDKIVAGVSSNISKSTGGNKKHAPHDSAVDIIVDSDEDEIFDDDEDDDDGADEQQNGQGGPEAKASLDYRDVLAAGASVVQKVMNAADGEEDSQRTGDSYHSSEGESDDQEDGDGGDDTESDDGDKKGGKSGGGGGGGGSDSGEDYTDDEDEGEDGYRPGGYHPVKIGEVYNQR